MKTVDIKGKPYVEVSERINHFRHSGEYEGWTMLTHIITHEEGVIIMKATIYDDEGKERANGYAYEKENSTFINKTSYIENCETSAWGRALANLGIGVDTSVASAEEVGNAVKQQGEPDQKAAPLLEQALAHFNKKHGTDIELEPFTKGVINVYGTKPTTEKGLKIILEGGKVQGKDYPALTPDDCVDDIDEVIPPKEESKPLELTDMQKKRIESGFVDLLDTRDDERSKELPEFEFSKDLYYDKIKELGVPANYEAIQKINKEMNIIDVIVRAE